MNAEPLARLTVLLTTEQFQRLENYCQLQGYKKSTLVARLIRDFLRELETSSPEDYKTKQG